LSFYIRHRCKKYSIFEQLKKFFNKPIDIVGKSIYHKRKFQRERILALCEKYIGVMPKGDLGLQPPSASHKSGIALREKDFEQSQIVISSPAFSCDHPDRFAPFVAVFEDAAAENRKFTFSLLTKTDLIDRIGDDILNTHLNAFLELAK